MTAMHGLFFANFARPLRSLRLKVSYRKGREETPEGRKANRDEGGLNLFIAESGEYAEKLY
jgi:hypothetical protein